MKFLNSFKKEIKTKWSTRLLIMVLTLIVCSIFASNIVLKHQHDLMKDVPIDRLKGYKKILNQPFKHIEIENFVYTSIRFDTNSIYGVFIQDQNRDTDKWAESISVKNDTLFIAFKDKHIDKLGDNYHLPIQIYAPQIETINVINGNLTVCSLNQKSINIKLLSKSRLILNDAMMQLNSFKILMTDESDFSVMKYKSEKNIDIQTFEADLKDSCYLHLGNVNIKNFKVNATDDNTIELSGKTLKSLMKK